MSTNTLITDLQNLLKTNNLKDFSFKTDFTRLEINNEVWDNFSKEELETLHNKLIDLSDHIEYEDKSDFSYLHDSLTASQSDQLIFPLYKHLITI